MSEETCTVCGAPLCFADKQTAPRCLDCATPTSEWTAEIERKLAAIDAAEPGWDRIYAVETLATDAPLYLRWLLDRVRELEGENARLRPAETKGCVSAARSPSGEGQP